ncbi:hypothetical protein AX769_00630 [Frondihabitans sp. PAMC 28766]|uniref:FAD-dependent oxidoreductase n=1 Tax=Frondihabitans sp. PAMC 28766 TaxID=1795630 RepID=UPI00078B8044|nr:FAD-dependent oxidoreductase [Frondihabitans sp. PAMC 28766]AMM18916.1 hypothetical protein AX769_00630 [Frondihabitans sp. PAMC 28766]
MSPVDPSPGSPTIAIVGSGPSGCYTAQFLRKKWHGAEIVVFDRLSTPYGLVRYGVAPDHLGTKAVTKQFDRLFERDGVQFAGSVEVGRDITLEALREAFDIVVLATGLSADRPLGEGAGAAPSALATTALTGVYGAGTLTRLINGHPDETADAVALGSRVTIVGHGNVAIDLVRLLLTPRADLLALGVAPEVADVLGAGPVTSIEVVGRSAVEVAKFDVAMVRELAKSPDVRFEAEGLDLPVSEGIGDPARRSAVDELVAGSPADAGRTVRFRFGWTPDHVTGEGSVGGIVFTSADGQGRTLSLETDSVCTAIGFTEASTAAVRRAEHEGPGADIERGLLDDGLFVVGWLRRGPQGTIPANRADSKMVADTIVGEVDDERLPLGKPGWSAVEAALLDPSASVPTLI